MRIDMLLGRFPMNRQNKTFFFCHFQGERESLIARDQEERQQAMYKYQHVEKFRRQQSPLWNALHPTIVNEKILN